MSGITRRNFIGATSAAAGLTFGGILSPEARGDIPKIRLGIIGTGARGLQHLREGLWGSKDFEIVAVADMYSPHQRVGVLNAWLANAGLIIPSGSKPTPEQLVVLEISLKPVAYYDYKEMLAKEGLAAVVIATPPHTHATIIKDCLAAGKHIFCETPMTTGIDDARDVVANAHKSGLVVQIGHQRRYHPNYNLAVSPKHREGKIGRLAHATLWDHQNGDGRLRGFDLPSPQTEAQAKRRDELERQLNWRLYATPDGGPCIHSLPNSIDTANWFCGTVPCRVFASGGTSYWFDGRDTPDNLAAIFDYAILKGGAGFRAADGRGSHHDIHALNRSYSLRCCYSYSMINAELGVREDIRGDWALVALSPAGLSTRILESRVDPQHDFPADERKEIWARYKKLLEGMTEAERRAYEVSRGQSSPPPPEFEPDTVQNRIIHAIGSEESPEVHQFRAFADHIRNGGTPRANVMVGLAAVIAGESARRSYETGQPVDIDPALMEFDFETPSISMYDENAAPIPGTTELM